jgi:chitinase
MAFAASNLLVDGSSYSPFASISQVRDLFDNGTQVGIAIGGWCDNEGFETSIKTNEY